MLKSALPIWTILLIFILMGCAEPKEAGKSGSITSPTAEITMQNSMPGSNEIPKLESASQLASRLVSSCWLELDSEISTVICMAYPKISGSDLEWTYENMIHSGITFEFQPYDRIPVIRVILKECIDSVCEEVEAIINVPEREL
jgi:hypothetical protein